MTFKRVFGAAVVCDIIWINRSFCMLHPQFTASMSSCFSIQVVRPATVKRSSRFRYCGVTNNDEVTTFLLKVLYCMVARESVLLPPNRTAIAWHPKSSITVVVLFGRLNVLAQDRRTESPFRSF